MARRTPPVDQRELAVEVVRAPIDERRRERLLDLLLTIRDRQRSRNEAAAAVIASPRDVTPAS